MHFGLTTYRITNAEVVDRLKALGLKLSEKRIHEIFKNPFYCGMISHNALKGEIVKGRHEPLISQEIFLKVNDIKSRIYGATKNSQYENTPLKGLLKCDNCGETLRGYIVKKKGLYYYKCNSDKKCGCNKSAKELHKNFLEILDEIKLEPDYSELFKDQLRLIYAQLNEDRDKVNESYQMQLKEIESKIERLEERFINEEIKPELYEKFAEKFKSEKKAIRENIKRNPISGSNLEFYINRSIELSSELPSLWSSSNYANKQKLQNLIFPEGIYYNKKKDESRTPKINSIFLSIAQLKQVSGQKNNGLQSDLSLKSVSVVPTGIEPVSKV